VTSDTAEQTRRNRYLRSRYRKIVRFAAIVLLKSWFFELLLPQIGLARIAERTRIRRFRKVARNFKKLALELSGLMIKVAQFVSSRMDILPAEITRELDGLQDRVPPEPFHLVRRQIEDSLGMRIDDAFLEFDETPIAAASLGQAHAARLLAPAGVASDRVVVKVLRPGIEEIVDVDLRALRKVSVWMSKVKLISRRADAPALVEEFAATTYEEIDYLNEAKNLATFERNFADDPYVGTPNVVWDFSSKRVLTLEDVTAIKISDVDALTAAGISPSAVSAEFARVTFQQIFVHGFFHADPHPGNVFVKPSADNPGGFQLVFIDFGMMGRITNQQRENLTRFIFALARRDAQGWVDSVERLHLLLPSADRVQLEQAIDVMFRRFGGVAVTEIANTDLSVFKDLALEFSDLLRTLPFQVPENFLLLVRSISLVSGVASGLNRDFNIWDALDPFARSLLAGGAKGAAETVLSTAWESLNTLAQLPKRVDNLIGRLERGEITIRNTQLEKRVSRVERGQSRLIFALYFCGLLVVGSYLRSIGDPLGNPLLAASLLPLVLGLLPR